MIEGPFALALGAGLIAALNPCGFAMLPAYLTYFVGTGEEEDDRGVVGGLVRALAVSAALTAGFVVVFGAFGLVFSHFSRSLLENLPWVTIVIGFGLVGLGVAMLAGRQVTVATPKWSSGSATRELPSMFLFGVSYAVASLSCTIGPFLAVTTSTFTRESYLSGVLIFVVYGLGMGLLVSMLTVAVALARSSVVGVMRRAMRYVTRISGAMLVLAGAYVAWYGWIEVRINRGELVDDPLYDFGEDVRSRAAEWVDSAGATRIALVSGVVVAAIVAAAWLRRRRREEGSGRLASPVQVP